MAEIAVSQEEAAYSIVYDLIAWVLVRVVALLIGDSRGRELRVWRWPGGAPDLDVAEQLPAAALRAVNSKLNFR